MLGLDVEERFRRHDPRAKFIPMARIDDEDKPGRIASAMSDIIVAHVGKDEWLAEGQMNLSFGEIMDNVLTHSESAVPGIAAAQYYPTYRMVELCVADSGRGIAASMATNERYRKEDEERLMHLALEENYGEYIGMRAFEDYKTSGGMGLTYAATLVRAVKGKMWIVSRENAVEVSENGTSTLRGLYYPGTLVSLRLPVDRDAVVRASQIISGGPDIPVVWREDRGWVDLMGREVDVNGVTGTANGLW